jgi:hypothetical protein
MSQFSAMRGLWRERSVPSPARKARPTPRIVPLPFTFVPSRCEHAGSLPEVWDTTVTSIANVFSCGASYANPRDNFVSEGPRSVRSISKPHDLVVHFVSIEGQACMRCPSSMLVMGHTKSLCPNTRHLDGLSMSSMGHFRDSCPNTRPSSRCSTIRVGQIIHDMGHISGPSRAILAPNATHRAS